MLKNNNFDKVSFSLSTNIFKNISTGEQFNVDYLLSKSEIQNGYKRFVNNQSVFANYYYQHRYIKVEYPLRFLLKNLNKKKVLISGCGIGQLYLYRACLSEGLECKLTAWFFLNFIFEFALILKSLIVMFFSIIYVSLKILSEPKVISENPQKIMVIINCKSSIRKLKKFIEVNKANIFYDFFRIKKKHMKSFGVNSQSFFSDYSFSSRVKLLSKNLSFNKIYERFSQIKSLFYEENKASNFDVVFFEFFCSRVIFEIINEAFLDDAISKNKTLQSVVSGSTNERYAVVQERICKKYNLQTICIPHGVSPAFRMPHGLFGQKYFCLSKSEKNILDSLYPDELIDFVFDINFINKCLRVNVSGCFFNKKIVFFTSSRNFSADQNVIDLIASCGKEFYIKLHPNDSLQNYLIPSSCAIIQDFNEAISNSIVISITSAVLLDALYNDSLSVSCQLDKYSVFEAKYFYAGTLDEEVIKFFNEEKFLNFLKGLK